MVDNPRCRYIMNPFPAGGAVISTAYIQGNPENARRMVQAMNQAIDAIRLDEASAKALLPKYTPIESAIASKSKLYNWWKTEEMKNEEIQKLADVLLGWKELSKKVDTSQMAYK